ncbi:TPA: lysophospholipid acyltransferase family protein [Candidatus Galligastranaerophilus faecipullorum]|nr:lysophospholipid acyltransferase family protein [Candidatus Galligastranaerophilus faecipullorum]
MNSDTPQHMYSAVPPTKMRNREEKFREAKNSPFWHFVGDIVFAKMIEARFYSVMYKNLERLENRDKNRATIFYAPHNNWWDGVLAYNIVYRIIKKVIKKLRFRFMIEEMNRFPLFQYVGCFPINKKSPQASMKFLRYAVTTLKDPDIAFWIFPQGIIRPPMYRPEIFQSGLAYIVKEAVKQFGGVNLVPVAINYTFLRQDRPEILIEFGEPKIVTDAGLDRKEFTHALEREFEHFLDKQQSDISSANFEGYHYLYRQKLKWWRYIEQKLKAKGLKNKEIIDLK